MQSLNMPLVSWGELVFLWAEKLGAVSSCLQLLSDKTDVCDGQAEKMGKEEKKHTSCSQPPHTHK